MRKDATSEFSLSGLEYYSPRDYLNVVKSRKWLVLSIAVIFTIATAVVAKFLPNHYNATTVILVDPRKVPDNMVMSTVTSAVSDRLVTIREQILSTTRLTQVIDEMQLYPEMKGKNTQEEIVSAMRKAISIDVVASTNADRGLGAFRITYDNVDPVRAARVTNRLASLFIEQNIKEREQQVLGTADFLDKETQEAKDDLAKKEEEISQLKAKYASDLPESQTLHVEALSTLQLELRSEVDAASRVQQQIVYLESLQQQSKPVVTVDDTTPESAELAATRTQLSKVRGEIRSLLQRYGPKHPDILRRQADADKLQEAIATLEEKIAKQQAQAPPPVVPRSRNPVLLSQESALQQELQKHLQREKELKEQISYHESKLERIPVVQQQTAAVMRDYQSAQDRYRHLLDRKYAADMSSDLESRQKGERFVVLDPAQVPEKPYSPNRILIDSVGAVVGVLLGVVFAFVLEVLDSSVKTERELRERFHLTILGEVPLLNINKPAKLGLRSIGAQANAVQFFCAACLILFRRG